MKKLEENQLESITGGVTARACMLMGGVTLLYAAAQQCGWALGTFAGAAGAGCFDD